MIKVLYFGMNRKWYYKRSTDIDDSVDPNILKENGIDMYWVGPGHYNPASSSKDITQLYNRIGGKPDILITSAVWKYQYIKANPKDKQRFLEHFNTTPEEMNRYEMLYNEILKNNEIKHIRIEHDFWWKDDPATIKPMDGKVYRIFSPVASPANLPLLKKFLPNSQLYPLPFSVKDEFAYCEVFPQKKYDYMIPGKGKIGHALYPYRSATKIVMEPYKNNYKLYSGYNGNPIYRPTQWDYFMILRQTKILVWCGLYWKVQNKKMGELLNSGSLVIGEPGIKRYTELGIKDGEHMIMCEPNKLKDTIDYFLKNDKEREEIAANGRKFFLKNMTSTIITERYFIPSIKKIYTEPYIKIPGEK